MYYDCNCNVYICLSTVGTDQQHLPVVLIMVFGVAEVAAKMFGMLPAVRPAEVLLLPTVLTDRLPGEAFFIGTTTLLQRNHLNILGFAFT